MRGGSLPSHNVGGADAGRAIHAPEHLYVVSGKPFERSAGPRRPGLVVMWWGPDAHRCTTAPRDVLAGCNAATRCPRCPSTDWWWLRVDVSLRWAGRGLPVHEGAAAASLNENDPFQSCTWDMQGLLKLWRHLRGALIPPHGVVVVGSVFFGGRRQKFSKFFWGGVRFLVGPRQPENPD